MVDIKSYLHVMIDRPKYIENRRSNELSKRNFIHLFHRLYILHTVWQAEKKIAFIPFLNHCSIIGLRAY